MGPAGATGTWRRGLPALLIVALAILPFTPALGNGFPFDDTLASERTADHEPDPVIADLHAPWHYFTLQYWAGGGRQSRLYRPVTILSYALTHHLLAKHLGDTERRALPHHAINLVLNAWAALLVLWLMRDLGMRAPGATLVAALFAVHALHSEVVASIAGRAELFSFCFGAAALLALRRAQGGAPGRWTGLAGLLLFLAFGSKESALAWIPFVPCYLAARAWRHGAAAGPVLRANAARMAAAALPAVVLFLGLRAAAIAGLREDVFYAANPLYHEATSVRLLTAVKVWGYALYKCVVPFSPASIYGPHALALVHTAADPGFVAAAAVLLGGLTAGVWRASGRPLLFLGVAVFFGFSCMTSNVPLVIGTIFGERLYFIPSLGVCMLPALLLPHVGARGRHAVVLVGAIWIAACIVVDVERSLVWKDNRTLMIHDAAVQPRCASLQVKAATMHRWLRGQDEARRDHHERESWRLLRLGQEMDPGYVNAMATEASFRAEDGDHDGAIRVLEAALRSRRLPISGLEASIRADLGMLLITAGKRPHAGLEHLRRAVELRPDAFAFRHALLDHGIGVLPPDVIRPILVEACERHPKDVILQVFQAAFIEAYGERDAANHGHIADILTAVFDVVPAAAMQQPRYILARIHLGEARLALGDLAAARQDFELVLATQTALPAHRERARDGLAAIDRRSR